MKYIYKYNVYVIAENFENAEIKMCELIPVAGGINAEHFCIVYSTKKHEN